ncbi:MAG: hypothetical protein U9P71_02030 [Campylobacterota bacterium]|nr:hypothetical protein [Campylobacterota bacterium]
MLKLLFLLWMLTLLLQGNVSKSEMTSSLSVDYKLLFQQSVKDTSAIIKRGEYDRIALFNENIDTVVYFLNAQQSQVLITQDIITNIKNYSKIVNLTYGALNKKAPSLFTDRYNILEGLELFNKKINSIGLRELLVGWRELSKLKRDFIRHPTKKLKLDFNNKHSYIVLLITELYLDEEMEEPLYSFLKQYKEVFDMMEKAYADVGYTYVAKLKRLGYKIKSDLLFLPL